MSTWEMYFTSMIVHSWLPERLKVVYNLCNLRINISIKLIKNKFLVLNGVICYVFGFLKNGISSSMPEREIRGAKSSLLY